MDLRFHNTVDIPVGKVNIKGELTIPLHTKSIVIFSHGSGSSRFSKRNQEVAHFLQQRNFGTLLFDLLTEEEDQHYHNRFDIDLLTKRLVGATEWLETHIDAKDCSLGYFGASTGAASALKAAASLHQVKAVVSRGGRPDLVMDILPKVEAPVLLIVGKLDFDVIQMNEKAFEQIRSKKQLELIDGATHLFEEPGKMKIVSDLAAKWFGKYLVPVEVT